MQPSPLRTVPPKRPDQCMFDRSGNPLYPKVAAFPVENGE